MTTDAINRLRHEVATVIKGAEDAIDAAAVCLLAGGHLLLEDVPGVGKTMLARSLAASTTATTRRIQFTPDLLPSDVTGGNIFNQASREFELRPGPVFSNIVLADEINRASPKTQSALLEVMGEGQVTIEGTTYILPRPFMVIATQNPIDMDGTYPLPEAQLDRFLIKTAIGMPPTEEIEMDIIQAQAAGSPISHVRGVVTTEEVIRLIDDVARIHVDEAVLRYVARLARATRDSPDTKHGVSPRAAIGLVRAARAAAALAGRDHVNPDDVELLLLPVFAHRVVLSRSARLADLTQAQVVLAAARTVPAPVAQAR